jgi:hypothetical protein
MPFAGLMPSSEVDSDSDSEGKVSNPVAARELLEGAFDHNGNQHCTFNQMSANSRVQPKVHWFLACRQHRRLMQYRSVLKSIARHEGKPTCFHCWLCMSQEQMAEGCDMRQPSAHELVLYVHLQGLQFVGLLPEFQCEIRVLPGTYGAVDVWVPGWRIAIMVDGEQHFPGASGQHHSKSYLQQKETDDSFNAAVLAGQGQPYITGLLRVHWEHVAVCEQWVLRAAQLAAVCQRQGLKFVMLSWGAYPHIAL